MASMEMSSWILTGTFSCVMAPSSLIMPSSVTVLRLAYRRHRSEIFHSFTTLSEGGREGREGGEGEGRGRGRGGGREEENIAYCASGFNYIILYVRAQKGSAWHKHEGSKIQIVTN